MYHQDLQDILASLSTLAASQALRDRQSESGIFGILPFIESSGGGRVTTNLLEAVMEDTAFLLSVDKRESLSMTEGRVGDRVCQIMGNLAKFLLARYEDHPEFLEKHLS